MLKKFLSHPKKNHLFFIFLITCAIILRFYNLNWDHGKTFHPDERNIDNAVTKINFFSHLDPEFFAYGGFSIYTYRAAANITSYITHDSSWTSDWGKINIIARFFSAFFSVLTIIPIYFLTKELLNRKAAFLAITFFTFIPASIQTAHFGVTESLITLIGITIALLSVKFIKRNDIKLTLLAAVVSGIGIAAKTSAVSFLIMPIAAYIFAIKKDRYKISYIIFNLAIFSFLTFVVFFIFSPYTFLSLDKFMESMRYESSVATGSLPVVYTLQFDNTLPYIFQLNNFFWQIGIISIFCVFGFFYLIFKTLKGRHKEFVIFLIFPILYFIYVGQWHTKFVRYMMPIIPFLIIAASIFLTVVYLKWKKLGTLLIIFTVVATVFWGLSFFSIYTRAQTRIAASEWIYINITAKSKLLGEQWDDGLPVNIGNLSPSQYNINQLAMYDADNLAKINYLANNLSSSDYIIFNSRRIYGTLIHLTKKYPITSNYYKLLFSGKLGYKKVAEFSSYPTFLGITINDDKSEETFQVYDHPKILIYKNENHFSNDYLQNIIKNEKIINYK